MGGFLKSKWFWLLLVAVVLAVLWQMGYLPTGTSGKYQAVFLSNNQVYFGKLMNSNSQFPKLTDIYYLRVTQTLQPQDPNRPQQQINLVKLGNELHGPEDAMKINRDHILFVEDLKADSQVVTAINDFKTQQ